MDPAVIEYRKRRQMRLDAKAQNNNESEEPTNEPKNVNTGGGGHGNTRLPFGLCQRYGIEIQKGWAPRDAWDALADKGVTPGSEFEKRKAKTTVKSRFGREFRNIHSKQNKDGSYALYGDFDSTSPFSEKKETHTNSRMCDFNCKDEMYSFLKEQGVNRFKDPDSGKVVNPSKMDLPETVAKVGDRRYKELTLGFRRDRTGHVGYGRGYAITGQGYDGKRVVLKVFKNPKEAIDYAKSIGCPNEKLRRTKDYEDYMKKGIAGGR